MDIIWLLCSSTFDVEWSFLNCLNMPVTQHLAHIELYNNLIVCITWHYPLPYHITEKKGSQFEPLSLPLSVDITLSQHSSMSSVSLSLELSLTWDIDGWPLQRSLCSFLFFWAGLLALSDHQRSTLGSALKLASEIRARTLQDTWTLVNFDCAKYRKHTFQLSIRCWKGNE